MVLKEATAAGQVYVAGNSHELLRFPMLNRTGRLLLVLAFFILGCSSKSSVTPKPDPSAAGSPATNGPTALSGTIGDLGEIQPITSSVVISNSGERLVYLSTTAITCDTVSVSRWLGSIDAGAQVVEIVVKSSFGTGTRSVDNGQVEVNYAKGGRSSSYEESATSGQVAFAINDAMGVAEGTVEVSYDNPAGMVSGSFHAEFCDAGQGF